MVDGYVHPTTDCRDGSSTSATQAPPRVPGEEGLLRAQEGGLWRLRRLLRRAPLRIHHPGLLWQVSQEGISPHPIASLSPPVHMCLRPRRNHDRAHQQFSCQLMSFPRSFLGWRPGGLSAMMCRPCTITTSPIPQRNAPVSPHRRRSRTLERQGLS